MKIFLLIDANSLIHRAYHALPPLLSPEGNPVGALYGISSALLKILRDEKPEYVAAAFDRPEPTFRKKMYQEYKAHRPKAEDDLVFQLIEARKVFDAFGIRYFEVPGFEGDDIIGTLTYKMKDLENLKIVILTGDLDTLQLVEKNHIVVRTPKRGIGETIVYDEKAIKDRFGLSPAQMTDYKGLVGDPSDNIPGIRGIGPKTAAEILQTYDTLENAFDRIPPQEKLAQKILPHKEIALFSKKLATISTEVPISPTIEELRFAPVFSDALKKYFETLGFQSLAKRLQENTAQSPSDFSSLAPATHKEKIQFSESVMLVPSLTYALKNLTNLSHSHLLKIGFDWKALLKKLWKKEGDVKDPLFDLQIAGWLLDPSQKDFSLSALAKRFLNTNEITVSEATFLSLYGFFQKKMEEYGLSQIFTRIEMPLIRVLGKMEERGIRINKEKLLALGKSLDEELERLTKEIYHEADCIFNLNSPKQVAQILFEKLEISPKKKRKTSSGQMKTGKDILEELREEHPIVERILAYREHFKIRTSFVTPLLEAMDSGNRIHTQFLQTGTTTGRLSSQEPNLQNIPQESRWSDTLRDTFEATPGFKFLSFDYSQLELRLLAYVANDAKLLRAFEEGKDIHTLTAANIFHVSETSVTPTMRRVAKTLNFGMVYGMGARSLSKESGLSLKDSEKFIQEYFENFPHIKKWQTRTKEEAKTFGFVKNLNGRRRWFLNTFTPLAQSEMERAAINMPIQGLGADILKEAMIKSSFALRENGWNSKAYLLLSIHDELLFEIQDDILKQAIPVLKTAIESTSSMPILLKTETKIGATWGSMKLF